MDIDQHKLQEELGKAIIIMNSKFSDLAASVSTVMSIYDKIIELVKTQKSEVPNKPTP